MHGSARRATVFGVVSMLAAMGELVDCKASYGEDPAGNPASDANIPPGDPPPDSATNGTSSSGGLPPPDAGDAAVDAPLVGDPCPPCPASTLCLGAGCVSTESVANSCAAPRDVTATSTAVLFLCPNGPTITLPSQCNGGGDYHVGVVRLGAGNWTVTASGTNPVLATADCGNVLSCAGASDTVTHAFPGLSTVMIGTTSTLSACETLSLSFTIEN